MSWLRGVHDLGYLAARTQAGLGAGYQQDWLLVGLNAGAFVGKGLWYLKDKINWITEGLKQKYSRLPTPTKIVDLGMLAVGLTDLLNGVLSPTKGEQFAAGITDFGSTLDKLQLAKADPLHWSGEAADKYNAQVEKLKGLVKEMQDHDKKLQDLMSQHAATITKLHQVIAACLLALVMAQGIALVLYAIPVYGPAISFWFQVAAVAATAGTTAVYQGITLYSSIYKTSNIDGMAGEYAATKGKAPIDGSFATIEVKGTAETSSQLSAFKSISATMTPEYATYTPTFNSMLAKGSGDLKPDEKKTISSLTASDSKATAEKTTDKTKDETSKTPAYTPPTLSQIGQATGQLSQLSQTVGQPVGQVMQGIQQISQSAQQAGQQAATAAPKAAELADDKKPDDGTDAAAGAGAGTEGAERAPVDAAAGGARPAEEARPTERVL